MRIQEVVLEGKHTLLSRKNSVKALAIDNIGNLLAAELDGRAIRVIDLVRDKLVAKIDLPDDSVDAVELSPDGCKLIVLDGKRDLHAFHVASGKRYGSVSKVPADFGPHAISGDGKLVFLEKYLPRKNRLVMEGLLWNVEQGKRPRTSRMGTSIAVRSRRTASSSPLREATTGRAPHCFGTQAPASARMSHLVTRMP